MYVTNGIEAVASITELRSATNKLVTHVHENPSHGILIQRNNEPKAVLLAYDRYVELLKGERKGR